MDWFGSQVCVLLATDEPDRPSCPLKKKKVLFLKSNWKLTACLNFVVYTGHKEACSQVKHSMSLSFLNGYFILLRCANYSPFWFGCSQF